MLYREVPAGAIKVHLRDVQQDDSVSCGPGSLMPVCRMYGVGPESLDDYRVACGTSSEGTYYQRLADYANQLGLDATVQQGMTRDDLKKLLDEGIPVLLSIQAWAEDQSTYDDPDSNFDGHFVTAIGYDEDDYFYLMDPSITGCLGYLTGDELDKRWHENEGIDVEEISSHLGIVIRGKDHTAAVRARRVE